MSQKFLRKYGVEATIKFTLIEVDGIDLRVDAPYASGDFKISKNEGAETNTTNGFTDEGTGYSLVLTATEMEAERISVYMVDQTGTKVWLDDVLEIETYGNISAQHEFDLDSVNRGTDNAVLAVNNRGTDNALLAVNVPANFSSLSISAGGLVDILQTAADKVWSTVARTITDKTGFSLSNTGIDSILSRPISNLDATGVFRSLYGVICKLVNKVDTTTTVGKLTIFKTDDITELATQTLTEDATANPVVGVDTD